MKNKKVRNDLLRGEERSHKEQLDCRIIFNAASNGMAFTDAESGRIVDVNTSWLAATGFVHEEVIGKTALELGLWSSPDRRTACLAELQEKGRLADFEATLVFKSIETPHLISAQFVEMNGSRYVLWEFRSLAMQIKSEEKLKWFNDLMKYVISHAQSAIAVHDRDMKYIFVSDNYLRQYRVREKDVIGKHHYDVFPDLPQKWRDVHQRVLAGAVERGDRDPYVRQDGSVEWTRWECRPWYEYDGSIGGLIVYTEVITEWVRREEALRESEERVRLAVRAGGTGIWEWDIATGILQWNDQLKTIFGLPLNVADLTLEKFISMIHPDDRAETENYFRTALAQHTEFNHEYRIILPDNTVRWIVAVGRGGYDREGHPLRMLGCALDITERKTMEADLRENECRLRGVTENVADTIIQSDRNGRITYINRVHSDLTMGQVMSSSLFDYVPPEQVPTVRKALAAAFELGETSHYESFGPGAKGEWSTYSVSVSPIIAGKEIVSAVFVARDITEKKKLEEQLVQAQKLESIGTLAGGIAHDFNNLLQGIFGYISMARMSLDRPEKANDMLKHTESALHTAVNLTTQLLTFAKGGKPLKKIVMLAPVVESCLRFSLSGSNAGYDLTVADGLWPVDADEGQLSQVIQNLVLNASEAMSESGTIYVSLHNVDSSCQEISELLEGSRFVRMDFRDTGTGIPAENIPKIFDPFFSTKQRGSGLGLATSYSIIKNHGGIITVKSEISKGSTFSIYLPASKEAERTRESSPGQLQSCKKCRILLMDDEEMVRNVGKAMIEVLGHEVECVNDGNAAIEAYRKAKDAGSPFDLVILDVTVRGGMGGEDAIRILRETAPGVVAVVSSGYADSAIIANYKDYGFSAFLNKPYTVEGIRNCINSLI